MTSDPIDSADFGIPWSRSGFYLELKTPGNYEKSNDSTHEKSYLLKKNVLQQYNL